MTEAREGRIVTVDDLADDLEDLAIEPGAVLMVHAALRRIGWVLGGAESVIRALREAIPGVTLIAQAGWEYDPFYLESWSAEQRAAYERCPVPYDPGSSGAAVADAGVFAERLRTWPGALSSSHPTARVVALGPRADWVVSPHPVGDAYGPQSPLARVVAAQGKVLALGAPLTSLSIFRFAERGAGLPNPRVHRDRVPVRHGETVEWVEFEEVDLDRGAYPYEKVLPAGEEAYEYFGARALAAGIGEAGTVGEARVLVFEAAPLAKSAIASIHGLFAGGTGYS